MNTNIAATIQKALEWRYAVKTFDADKKISKEQFSTILESGRLAPSSVGIEPWKFIIVENPEIRAKIREASYGQTKVTDASHLIVITHRTDAQNLVNEAVTRTAKNQGKTEADLAGYRGMLEGTVGQFSNDSDLQAWLRAQTYIPLGMMLETAALLDIDAGPMEGFDRKAVDTILGLSSKNLASVTMVAFGYRGNDPFASLPKTRQSVQEVVVTV